MGADEDRFGIAEGRLLAEDPLFSNKVATRALMIHHIRMMKRKDRDIARLETKLISLNKFEDKFGSIEIECEGFKSKKSLLIEYIKLKRTLEYTNDKMKFYRNAWKNQINPKDKYE
jgi:primosomal protein N''